ncbi:MAG: hypothetical protein GC189_02610 [Alphaproteobacteria bacterium]|nr:hypothetical protein [Alphaproteobacteria bacterium]
MTDQTFTDFDAELRRTFATAEGPVDDGFSVAVAHRVAAKERGAQLGAWARLAALLVAGGAAAYGVIALIRELGPMLMAQFGMEVVTLQSALANANAGEAVSSMMLTQMLIVLGLGAGGVAAYRAVSE